jgi:hypothetical protein
MCMPPSGIGRIAGENVCRRRQNTRRCGHRIRAVRQEGVPFPPRFARCPEQVNGPRENRVSPLRQACDPL